MCHTEHAGPGGRAQTRSEKNKIKEDKKQRQAAWKTSNGKAQSSPSPSDLRDSSSVQATQNSSDPFKLDSNGGEFLSLEGDTRQPSTLSKQPTRTYPRDSSATHAAQESDDLVKGGASSRDLLELENEGETGALHSLHEPPFTTAPHGSTDPLPASDLQDSAVDQATQSSSDPFKIDDTAGDSTIGVERDAAPSTSPDRGIHHAAVKHISTRDERNEEETGITAESASEDSLEQEDGPVDALEDNTALRDGGDGREVEDVTPGPSLNAPLDSMEYAKAFVQKSISDAFLHERESQLHPWTLLIDVQKHTGKWFTREETEEMRSFYYQCRNTAREQKGKQKAIRQRKAIDDLFRSNPKIIPGVVCSISTLKALQAAHRNATLNAATPQPAPANALPHAAPQQVIQQAQAVHPTIFQQILLTLAQLNVLGDIQNIVQGGVDNFLLVPIDNAIGWVEDFGHGIRMRVQDFIVDISNQALEYLQGINWGQLAWNAAAFTFNGGVKIVLAAPGVTVTVAVKSYNHLSAAGSLAWTALCAGGRAIRATASRVASLCGRKRKFDEVDDEEKQLALTQDQGEHIQVRSTNGFGIYSTPHNLGLDENDFNKNPPQVESPRTTYYRNNSGKTVTGWDVHQDGHVTSYVVVRCPSDTTAKRAFSAECISNLQELGNVTVDYERITGGISFTVDPAGPGDTITSNGKWELRGMWVLDVPDHVAEGQPGLTGEAPGIRSEPMQDIVETGRPKRAKYPRSNLRGQGQQLTYSTSTALRTQSNSTSRTQAQSASGASTSSAFSGFLPTSSLPTGSSAAATAQAQPQSSTSGFYGSAMPASQSATAPPWSFGQSSVTPSLGSSRSGSNLPSTSNAGHGQAPTAPTDENRKKMSIGNMLNPNTQQGSQPHSALSQAPATTSTGSTAWNTPNAALQATSTAQAQPRWQPGLRYVPSGHGPPTPNAQRSAAYLNAQASSTTAPTSANTLSASTNLASANFTAPSSANTSSAPTTQAPFDFSAPPTTTPSGSSALNQPPTTQSTSQPFQFNANFAPGLGAGSVGPKSISYAGRGRQNGAFTPSGFHDYSSAPSSASILAGMADQHSAAAAQGFSATNSSDAQDQDDGPRNKKRRHD